MNIIEEHHPSKIVGVYENESTAKQTAKRLVDEGGVLADEINIVSPQDKKFESKVEPETKAIGRTLIASHMMLGLIGLSIGLLVGTALIIAGIQLATSSPVMLLIATGTLGTFMGLLVAGAVSLRPDHDSVVNDTRYAKNHKLWSVVVHTKDREHTKQAKQLMEGSAVRMSESL
ncbi:hypothetical protein [Aliiglaciecola lipolytica]|uniref:Transmembrane protein n=1 Tax=Aliiglaciecola lipolytica E3 TaxID=1127673 RepID=K6Y6H6_9ALTE|nr:hypothetical protein [Aliiglaciecola lipolytica]GAC13802.1 hypothetical protein GLIP_1161 [Aliiglaciecola lipolytica E3]